MKFLIAILLVGLFGFCSNERGISKIEIRKVDFDLTSIVRVDCDDYESYFKKEVTSVQIVDGVKIELFKNILKNFKVDDKNYLPDVRAKILIHYTDDTKVDIVCLSDLGIQLNGKSFLQNDALTTFVENASNK